MKELFDYTADIPLHLGTLPSDKAKFCLKIFNGILEKTRTDKKKLNGITFLLAVSCGIDSVAMLAIFAACRRCFGYKLHVAHFNHGIRQESSSEEKMAEDICRKLDIPFTIERGNTPEYSRIRKIGLEEAGRILRYDFFRSLQSKIPDCILCTAHHADDLCEDVLMRLVRGTAWPQLAGMKSFDRERALLRPLLHVTKQELSEFLHDMHFPVADDASNYDTAFLRNRIRHTVLPLLRRENPHFHKNILKLNNNAEYDEEHFQNLTALVFGHLTESGGTYALPLDILLKQDKSTRLHCYRALLKKLGCGHPITEIFEKLDNAVLKKHGGTMFKFSDNVRMQIQNNTLICFKKSIDQ